MKFWPQFKGAKKTEKIKKLTLSSAVEGSILRALGNSSIPSMPSSAQKAFQVASDPTADLRDFVEVIEGDESLSARVLKIANSVFFHRGHDTETIEESVSVIGVNEIRGLLSASSLAEIFPSRHPARNHLWCHDLAVASACKVIGAELLPGQEESLFLHGLMHDVGKLLLLQKVPEEYGQVFNKVKQGQSFQEAEAELFPFDHTEVGQLIAEKWRFGKELTRSIRFHHLSWNELATSPAENQLAMIVKGADNFAHSSGVVDWLVLNNLKSKASETLNSTLSHLGIETKKKADLLDKIRRQFQTDYELYHV